MRRTRASLKEQARVGEGHSADAMRQATVESSARGSGDQRQLLDPVPPGTTAERSPLPAIFSSALLSLDLDLHQIHEASFIAGEVPQNATSKLRLSLLLENVIKRHHEALSSASQNIIRTRPGRGRTLWKL
jgi:hypothetical protein